MCSVEKVKHYHILYGVVPVLLSGRWLNFFSPIAFLFQQPTLPTPVDYVLEFCCDEKSIWSIELCWWNDCIAHKCIYLRRFNFLFLSNVILSYDVWCFKKDFNHENWLDFTGLWGSRQSISILFSRIFQLTKGEGGWRLNFCQ